MRVLNFGSLNIDHVYRVSHISRPGETISAQSYSRFAGGKGGNQSVAIARAGSPVSHIGKIGPNGLWLMEDMKRDGVDVSRIVVSDQPGGHAIIQVEKSGQNSIVIFGGTNRQITRQEINSALAEARQDDIVLLQNEINRIPYIIEQADIRGLTVYFNPAPMDDNVLAYPLSTVAVFFINETEGEAFTGKTEDEAIISGMLERFPKAQVVLTLGKRGLLYGSRELGLIGRDIERDVPVVDSTGAGDTFIGFYTASICRGKSVKESLAYANLAASYCVTKPGAAASIPHASDLENF
jgi:ribokinase